MVSGRPHKGMEIKERRGSCIFIGGLATALLFWIPAFAGKTRLTAGVRFHSNRSCRFAPVHEGMKRGWSIEAIQC